MFPMATPFCVAMWPKNVRSPTWDGCHIWRENGNQRIYYWIVFRKIKNLLLTTLKTHTHTHTNYFPALVVVTYVSCVTAAVWPLTVVAVSAVRTPPSSIQSGSTDVCVCERAQVHIHHSFEKSSSKVFRIQLVYRVGWRTTWPELRVFVVASKLQILLKFKRSSAELCSRSKLIK